MKALYTTTNFYANDRAESLATSRSLMHVSEAVFLHGLDQVNVFEGLFTITLKKHVPKQRLKSKHTHKSLGINGTLRRNLNKPLRMKVSHSPADFRKARRVGESRSSMGLFWGSNKVGPGKPVEKSNNFKMYLLLNMVILHCHVSLLQGTWSALENQEKIGRVK